MWNYYSDNVIVGTLSGIGHYSFLNGPSTINTITATGTINSGTKNTDNGKIIIKNLYGKIVRAGNMDFEIENAYKGSVITNYDNSLYTGTTTVKNDYR